MPLNLTFTANLAVIQCPCGPLGPLSMPVSVPTGEGFQRGEPAGIATLSWFPPLKNSCEPARSTPIPVPGGTSRHNQLVLIDIKLSNISLPGGKLYAPSTLGAVTQRGQPLAVAKAPACKHAGDPTDLNRFATHMSPQIVHSAGVRHACRREALPTRGYSILGGSPRGLPSGGFPLWKPLSAAAASDGCVGPFNSGQWPQIG